MDYAIIQTGGKQYKVSQGDVLNIDKIDGKKGDIIVFDKVLFVRSGDDMNLGKPYLEDATVTAEYLEDKKGKKLDIYKFKAKVNYRRHIGFRHHYSMLKIKEITLTSKKSKKSVTEKPIKARKSRS
jgi:large subunit ribosomal protein L21